MKRDSKSICFIVSIIAIAMASFHLYTAAFGSLEGLLQRAVHLVFSASLILLIKPASPKSKLTVPWYDIVFVFIATASVGWIIYDYDRIIPRYFFVDPVLTTDIVFGCLTILIILECTRRTIGLPLVLIASVFLAYAFLGSYLPGMWGHRGYNLEAVIDQLYLQTYGIFGLPLGVSATYVILFVMLGEFLEKTGAGQFFIKFAYSLTGRFRGGPAQTAVLGSALMGMISGTAVGNVATTGTFTIPLMKGIGYSPEEAGAIETAASCGGQITPPIMGAGAFIMAEITGLQYVEIAKRSLVPALLYYLVTSIFVYIKARKRNVRLVDKADIPNIWKVMREGGIFLVPILLLAYLLIRGYTPIFAGIVAIVSVVILSMLNKTTRYHPKVLLKAMEDGAKKATTIAAACACAGIIVGVVTLTGLGGKFASIVVASSQGILLIAVVLVGIASFIMGMGLPVVVSYLLLAVLAAPALVGLGTSVLAAHLAVFWFGQLANITPPVCLAAFTAATIAEGHPMKTGWEAFKYGIGLAALPVLFIYSNILFDGTPFQNVSSVICGIVSLAGFVFVVEGWLLKKLSVIARLFLAIAVIFIFSPGVILDIIGFAIFAIVLYYQIVQVKNVLPTARDMAK